MKIKTTIFTIFFAILFSIVAFAQSLTVAVAANVQYAFEELKGEFTKDTGVEVKAVYASSGKITAQVEGGAPFDLFVSADMDYPQALEKEGMAYNSTKVYAYGKLVLWTMSDVDLSLGVESLVQETVRKIAIATPKTAPYGRGAVNALKYYGIYPKVSSKLVYGESIAQASQFISTRAADAGFTAKSIVMAKNMQGKGKWVEVDSKAYDPIAQGAVILKHARKNDLAAAQKLFDFLFSDKARAIFEKYGYTLP